MLLIDAALSLDPVQKIVLRLVIYFNRSLQTQSFAVDFNMWTYKHGGKHHWKQLWFEPS